MSKPMDTKTLSLPELQRLLAERQAALHALQFKVATRQLTKVRQIRVARRDIAQIMTAMRRASAS